MNERTCGSEKARGFSIEHIKLVSLSLYIFWKNVFHLVFKQFGIIILWNMKFAALLNNTEGPLKEHVVES